MDSQLDNLHYMDIQILVGFSLTRNLAYFLNRRISFSDPVFSVTDRIARLVCGATIKNTVDKVTISLCQASFGLLITSKGLTQPANKVKQTYGHSVKATLKITTKTLIILFKNSGTDLGRSTV